MDETPLDEMDTPYGKLHKPKHRVVQFAFLLLAFFGGPLLGEAIGRALGGLSDTAQIALYLPFVAILFLGYGLWVARLNAIAFEGIGRGILKALFMLIVRRRKPQNIEDVLPSKEKLLRMAVQAQKAGWSFFTVSIPIALVAALLALLFESATPGLMRLLAVGGSCLLWGYLLGFLARRGYLPVLEGE